MDVGPQHRHHRHPGLERSEHDEEALGDTGEARSVVVKTAPGKRVGSVPLGNGMYLIAEMPENIVRLYNRRGACLAAARVTAEVMPGVVQLPTGAWYDPDDPAAERPMCVHGNPNVLTRDVGTSSLAQGSSGQLTAVQVERYTGELAPIRAYEPPA